MTRAIFPGSQLPGIFTPEGRPDWPPQVANDCGVSPLTWLVALSFSLSLWAGLVVLAIRLARLVLG